MLKTWFSMYINHATMLDHLVYHTQQWTNGGFHEMEMWNSYDSFPFWKKKEREMHMWHLSTLQINTHFAKLVGSHFAKAGHASIIIISSLTWFQTVGHPHNLSFNQNHILLWPILIVSAIQPLMINNKSSMTAPSCLSV